MTITKKLIFVAAVIMLFGCFAFAEEACSHTWTNYTASGTGSHTAVCSKCGEQLTEAHSLETKRTQATCIAPATVKYTCIKCGYSTEPFTDGDVGTEHSWGNYITTKEPTCTETGSQIRSCQLCGITETVTLEKADHQYGAWASNDDYWHARKCVTCGDTQKERHDSEVARTVIYAQDTRLGKKSLTCTGCGYMYTRWYTSTSSKILSQEDVTSDGYIMFGTLNVETGKTYIIRMYPNSSFAYTAETDSVILLYANATSLEYRGIRLTSGTGTLALENTPARLEFIACDSGARLNIDCGDSMIIAGNSVLTKANDGSDIVTVKNGSAYKLSVYGKSGCYVDGGVISSEGSQILTADISYNASAQRLTVKPGKTGVSLTVYSGDAVLFTGKDETKYECALSKNSLSDGWYAVLADTATGAAYSSPAFDSEGELLLKTVGSAEQNAIEETVPETAEEPEELPIEEAVEVPEIIGFSTETEALVHMAPDIMVTVKGGVYTVEVSELPEGWKVEMIRFVQQYGETGYKLVNVFSDTASYQLLGGAGSISARVFMTDSTGDPIEYLAGSFELLGY